MRQEDTKDFGISIGRVALVLALLVFVAKPVAPQVLPPDAVARFHINNANYLTDVGKYLEAMEELDTAFDFSQGTDIKAEAASLKGLLLATYLDNPRAAIAQYDGIAQNFRTGAFYEPAIFQSAMLHYQLDELPETQRLLEQYTKEFPNGARSATADFLLDQVKAGSKAAPVVKAAPAKLIRIALKDAGAITLTSTQVMTLDGAAAGTTLKIAAKDVAGAKSVVRSTGRIGVDGTIYRGSIVVFPESNQLTVVNEISVEEYLYSVVASEVSASWPAESLKAQAVAARTYAYYNILHPRSPGKFDLYDDVRSQSYTGVSREDARVRAAVDATKGQVLIYKGNIILAYFTSNNGGTMADPAYVFGTGFPYFQPNKDEYSGLQPLGKWTRTFPLAAVEDALQKSGYPVKGIRSITAVKSCPSGRVVELAIEYTGGKIQLKTRTQLRRAINDYIKPMLSPENMPEILMSIQIKGTSLEIAGGGWGHGVGMSQYGAKGMAEKNLPYTAILANYYVGTDLKTLN